MRELTHDQKLSIAMKIMARFGREIEGDEYDKVYTMLCLLEPNSQSNNQRSWTDTYIVGDLQYDVTFGIEDKPLISVKKYEQ